MDPKKRTTDQGSPTASQGDIFATTHWSVVLAAGQAESPASRGALAQLCEAYWYPLYAFARSRGNSPHDAEDLTQGFFAQLLGRNYFADLHQSKGKFRAFLIAAFKHFLADRHDWDQTRKRGGGGTLLSLDARDAEERYQLEPIDALSPDRLYDLQWAKTLMAKVRDRQRQEFADQGEADLYEALKGLGAREDGEPTYAEKAARLGLSLSAVKSAALRMRQRYGQLLRWEIAQTVATPAEIDREIQNLLAILSE